MKDTRPNEYYELKQDNDGNHRVYMRDANQQSYFRIVGFGSTEQEALDDAFSKRLEKQITYTVVDPPYLTIYKDGERYEAGQ